MCSSNAPENTQSDECCVVCGARSPTLTYIYTGEGRRGPFCPHHAETNRNKSYCNIIDHHDALALARERRRHYSRGFKSRASTRSAT